MIYLQENGTKTHTLVNNQHDLEYDKIQVKENKKKTMKLIHVLLAIQKQRKNFETDE